MHTPDALSRTPLKVTSKLEHHTEAHVDGIISVLQVTDEKLEDIKTMISLQNFIPIGTFEMNCQHTKD